MIAPSFTLVAAVALAAFIAGGAGAWNVQAWRFEAEKSRAVQRAARDLARAVEVQDRAVSAYITQRESSARKTERVIRYVDKIVERPVYRNVCLDADGLRALRATIDGTAAGPEPGPAVPGAALSE